MIDDSYTKSLLHFNGADAGVIFTDEVGADKVWTPVGTAQLDTAQQKFGSASGLFDGNSDGIWIDDGTAWNLGALNFTMDFWVRSTQTTQYATLLSRQIGAYGTGSWTILTSSTGAGDVAFWAREYSAGSPMLVTAGSLFNTGSWVHIALVRYANDWTLYVDGISKATRNTATTITVATARTYIGMDGNYGRYFNGWIDEFRFSKIARWTAAFTPPTVEYHHSKTYLHARRDRMNMRGVSIQTS